MYHPNKLFQKSPVRVVPAKINIFDILFIATWSMNNSLDKKKRECTISTASGCPQRNQNVKWYFSGLSITSIKFLMDYAYAMRMYKKCKRKSSPRANFRTYQKNLHKQFNFLRVKKVYRSNHMAVKWNPRLHKNSALKTDRETHSWRQLNINFMQLYLNDN